MKTKFDPLISVVKQKIKLCEQAISRIEKDIMNHQEEIRLLLCQIQKFQVPYSGSSSVFHQVYEERRACLNMVDAEQEKIAQLKNQKLQKEQECRGYYMELEKVSFLQQKVLREFLAKLKVKEQKEVNEVANLCFWINHGERR